MESFGNSNDLDVVRAFVDAAIKDGWERSETYPGSEYDTIDTACRLRRDGFLIQVLARPADRLHRCNASLHAWCPEGIAIALRIAPYPGMQFFRDGVRRCGYCEATNVPTHRVGFAGRCCDACLPTQRKRLESGNWTN